MTDRSMRTIGLVALAVSCGLLAFTWELNARTRRVVSAAVAKNEAGRARVKLLLDRQDEEIDELKAALERLIKAEVR